MTREQVERKMIELIHHEPFIPFQVVMANGEVFVVPHPRLAITQSGAGFIGPEGAIVDIDFAGVQRIGTLSPRGGL